MSVPEADLDHLFSLPLEQFVAERKRLSRALAQAGQRDDARALDKLPRPSVSAWVVNQVARRAPALVKRLGELTERLRGAQGRAASGGGDDFAAMTAEHRQTLGALRELADEILGTSGHGASPQLLRRVITNLRAGVAEPDTRPLVEQGRLGRDVEEADFTTLFEALPPSAGGAREEPGDRHEDDDSAGQRSEPRGRVSPLRGTATAVRPAAAPRPTKDTTAPARDDTAAAARMAAERAQRDAERAREKARAAAERRLVRLREAAATAREALAAEERTVAAARAALAAKEEQLARVRTASDQAAAAVAAIEDELEQLR